MILETTGPDQVAAAQPWEVPASRRLPLQREALHGAPEAEPAKAGFSDTGKGWKRMETGKQYNIELQFVEFLHEFISMVPV